MQRLATRKIRHRRFLESSLIFVPLVYAAVLLIGPMLGMAWGALSNGFEYFFSQAVSPDGLSAWSLTLVLSIAATSINTMFGIPVAIVLARHDFRGRTLLNSLVELPFAISPVIAGFMLVLLFGHDGWFAPLFDALGIKVIFSLPGMILVTTFVSLPFVIREVMPVLEQTGTTQEQAARTMGAPAWHIFWQVTLPSIRWGLLYGVSLTWARALGEFGAVLVVSAGVSRSTETATLYIFRSLDDRNYGGAYAMALVLVLISLTILGVMQLIKRRVEDS
jgi:sulfate transport system permease protein